MRLEKVSMCALHIAVSKEGVAKGGSNLFINTSIDTL